MSLKPSKILIPLLTLALLAACSTGVKGDSGPLRESFPGQFLIGESYILKDGQRIEGDIAGIGATLIIENGARVTGDISMIGGNLEIGGTVFGDLNVFSASAVIRDSAVIAGDINQAFTTVQLSPRAVVNGTINTYLFPAAKSPASGQGLGKILSWFKPGHILFVKSAQILAMTLVTALAIYLFQKPTLRVSQSIRQNLPAAWGAGLLTMVAAPIISIVLIISICLSPVGLALILVFLISLMWGWAALGSIVGGQITRWLRLDWDEHLTAVIGAMALGLSAALISFIPCLGVLINMILASFGLGGVLLSRFGTHKEIRAE